MPIYTRTEVIEYSEMCEFLRHKNIEYTADMVDDSGRCDAWFFTNSEDARKFKNQFRQYIIGQEEAMLLVLQYGSAT